MNVQGAYSSTLRQIHQRTCVMRSLAGKSKAKSTNDDASKAAWEALSKGKTMFPVAELGQSAKNPNAKRFVRARQQLLNVLRTWCKAKGQEPDDLSEPNWAVFSGQLVLHWGKRWARVVGTQALKHVKGIQDLVEKDPEHTRYYSKWMEKWQGEVHVDVKCA